MSRDEQLYRFCTTYGGCDAPPLLQTDGIGSTKVPGLLTRRDYARWVRRYRATQPNHVCLVPGRLYTHYNYRNSEYHHYICLMSDEEVKELGIPGLYSS